MENKIKVLFVCIGNSCRSPMAESILNHVIETKPHIDSTKWFVRSAAIADWNVGYAPEPRCLQILAENGLTSDHIGIQITDADFMNYDYIFGMDDYNIEDLRELAPKKCSAKIELLGNYNCNALDKIIFDPYFETGIHGFRRCYDQILNCCENFVNQKISEMTK